jgi:hypothetical protein
VGFIKPEPVPAKTRTYECGYGPGFPRVRVRVAQENPRIARRIPYLKQRPLNKDGHLGDHLITLPIPILSAMYDAAFITR